MSSFILIIGLLLGVVSCNEVYFVAIITNIGARSPKKIKPPWISHTNELTSIGMRQLYLLGRDYSQRYMKTLLNKQFLPFEVVLRAAYENWSVTTATANAFARGLYYPGTGNNLTKIQVERAVPPYEGASFTKEQEKLGNNSLLYLHETLPIMINGGDKDYVLSATSHCKGIKTSILNYIEDNIELKDKRDKLEHRTQSEIKTILEEICKINIKSLEDALDCRDYIIAAEHYAIDLGDKTKQVMNLLNYIHDFVNYKEFYADIRVAKVVGNGILKDILKCSDIKDRKMNVYTVEDSNIFALLKLIEYKGHAFAPFASSLEFIFSKAANEAFVELKYNGIKIDWEVKSVSKFKEWVDRNTYSEDDFMRICIQGINRTSTDDSIWIAAGFIVAGLLLIAVILTAIYARRRSQMVKYYDKV